MMKRSRPHVANRLNLSNEDSRITILLSVTGVVHYPLLANSIPGITVRVMRHLINILIVIIVGRVVWVKDGDSFLMRADGVKYEVRMYGIDAPEYKQLGGNNALEA